MKASPEYRDLTDPCIIQLNKRNGKAECADDTGGGGGGILITPLGAGRTPTFWEETVTTVAGQSYVETTNTIPAGAIVERCLVKTTAPITGGYRLGVEGADGIYGEVDGTLDSTNLTDIYFPHDHANYIEAPRRISTDRVGGFLAGGEALVACFYRTYNAQP